MKGKNRSLGYNSLSMIKDARKIKSKNYIPWIDITRGFAVLFLIMTHVGVPVFLNLLTFPKDYFMHIFKTFVNPMFYFLSGYAMFINYPQIDNYRAYLKRKLKYILPNYLIWGTIVFFLTISWTYINSKRLDEYFKVQEIVYLLITTILNVLTGRVNVLFFVYLLIQFYILYPLFLKIFNKFRDPIILFILVFCLRLFLNFLSWQEVNVFFLNDFCLIIPYNEKHNIEICFFDMLFVFTHMFFTYLVFFILGIVCAKDKRIISLIKKNQFVKLLLIAIFLLYLFSTNFRSYLFSSIILLIMVSIFYEIKISRENQLKENTTEIRKIESQEVKRKTNLINIKIKNFLWNLGILSGGIYYVHPLFGPLIEILNIFINSVIINLITNISIYLFFLFLISLGLSALSLTLSYVLVKTIKNNIKQSKYIIGS